MQPTAIAPNSRIQVAQATPAPAPSGPVPGFARVREILDNSIQNWIKDQQREPHLDVHGPKFHWNTREELLKAVVEIGDGYPLIDPQLIGNGRAEETFLIQYLRHDGEMFVRMPSGGPYLPDEQIDEIARWIDAGCPENAPGQQSSLRSPDVQRALQFAQRFARPTDASRLQLAPPRP